MKAAGALAALPLIAMSSLWGASDAQIVDFMTTSLKSNPSVKVDTIKVMERAPLPGMKGWESVKVFMDLSMTRNGKTNDLKTTDMFFTSGKYIATDLIDATTKTSLKQQLAPKPSGADYNLEHLVSGSSKAPYKILVFSDPQCPFCKDFMTDALEASSKYPDKIAIYYYHFPLTTLHPSSPAIIRAEIAAQAAGIRDVASKVYNAMFEVQADDPDAVVAEFNKLIGTNLKKNDLFTKAVEMRYNADLDRGYAMMIHGTPAVFINGQPDPKRETFEKILKELKK